MQLKNLVPYVRLKINRHLLGSSALWPKMVYIIVNSRCNLFCKMCDVGQNQTDTQFTLNMLSANMDMPLEVFKRIVDELAPVRPVIAIISTEPLLWKHLPAAIEYAKKKGCKTQVGTNGLLLPKKIDDLASAGLDTLSISLDGTAEIHDKIRGGGGKSYANAVEGFLRAKDLGIKERLINHVVSDWNYLHLEDFAREVIKIHPTQVAFSHLNFVTQDMANTHNKYFGDIARATPTCISSIFPETIDYDLMYENLQKAAKIIKQGGGVHLIQTPYFNSAEDAKMYFTDPKKIFSRDHCRVPWEQAQFMANGDVIIMTRCFHIVMGNIMKESFGSIWNGKKMKDFRSSLRRVGMFPACTRCCGVL